MLSLRTAARRVLVRTRALATVPTPTGRVVQTHSTFIKGLIPILNKLSANDGLGTIVPARLFRAKGRSHQLQLRVTSEIPGGHKMIARKGSQVQEVFVRHTLDKEELELLIAGVGSRPRSSVCGGGGGDGDNSSSSGSSSSSSGRRRCGSSRSSRSRRSRSSSPGRTTSSSSSSSSSSSAKRTVGTPRRRPRRSGSSWSDKGYISTDETDERGVGGGEAPTSVEQQHSGYPARPAYWERER